MSSGKLKKVLTWRVISFSVAGMISYLYLGEIERSVVLTSILTVVMTIIHWLFELAWDGFGTGD